MAQPEDRIVVAYHRKKPMRIVVNVSRKRSRTGSQWRTRRASTNFIRFIFSFTSQSCIWSRGRLSRFEYSLIGVLTYFSFSTSIASCNDEEQNDNPATKRSYDVDREFRNARVPLTKNFYDPGDKSLLKRINLRLVKLIFSKNERTR